MTNGKAISTVPKAVRRILFYALGGGFGHVTRACHLAGEMGRRGIRTLVLCPDRCRSHVERTSPCQATANLERSQLALWFQRRLVEFEPDLLVMDTFPRGVLGEVVTPPGLAKLLVTRWVAPDYYRKPVVRKALQEFDEICWTEPRSDLSFPGLDCEPVMSMTAPLGRVAARLTMGADERPLILGMGSGEDSDQRKILHRLKRLGRLQQWDVRWFSRELGTYVEDLASLLKGADVIVSAAGYNSYYEIARAGVPVLFLPQQRTVDDQMKRARGVFGFSGRGEVRVHRSDQGWEASLLELMDRRTASRVADCPAPRGRDQVADVMSALLTLASSQKGKVFETTLRGL